MGYYCYLSPVNTSGDDIINWDEKAVISTYGITEENLSSKFNIYWSLFITWLFLLKLYSQGFLVLEEIANENSFLHDSVLCFVSPYPWQILQSINKLTNIISALNFV